MKSLTSLRRMQTIRRLPNYVRTSRPFHAWALLLGSNSQLSYEEFKYPVLHRSSDVLIKVHAASVNPIDVRNTEGFGKQSIGLLRRLFRSDFSCKSKGNTEKGLCIEDHSRRILGRDFSGVVIKTGSDVKHLAVNDEVFGAVDITRDGSHAELCVVDASKVVKKPANLSHIEAASIPSAALTFTSAVHTFGQIQDLAGKRVILNGAAGGIGLLAIQYLKAKQAEVTAVCSAEARHLVEKLEPDHILDYQNPEFKEQSRRLAGYDVAFDCVGDESYISLCKPGGVFVTVNNDLLSNLDGYGMGLGVAKSAADFTSAAIQAWGNHGVHYRWAFFINSKDTLEDIKKLCEEEKIKPVIDAVYTFDQVPEAYAKVGPCKGRGKTVIDILSKEKLNH